jgi:membrane protein implicated in regulation of membrane protease activity
VHAAMRQRAPSRPEPGDDNICSHGPISARPSRYGRIALRPIAGPPSGETLSPVSELDVQPLVTSDVQFHVLGAEAHAISDDPALSEPTGTVHLAFGQTRRLLMRFKDYADTAARMRTVRAAGPNAAAAPNWLDGGVAAIVWLVASIALAVAEALTGDFFLLMLAGGALAAAGSAAVFDFPLWVDAVVFGVVSLGLLAGVRPALLRRMRSQPALPTNVQALEGKNALVLQEVTSTSGQIKLAGEVWTARPLDSADTYPEGATVTVMQIDGATALVWRHA